MHDLQTHYADAAAHLASRPGNEEWEDEADAPLYRSVFRHGDLPAPPAELSTGGMYVRRGSHIYSSLAVDAVHLFSTPDVYRCLGLWIVACLLEPGSHAFCLQVTRPGSEVRRICFDRRYRSLDGAQPGLHTQPQAAVYHPAPPSAFPLADQAPPLPHVWLTDGKEHFAGFGDAERDTLLGFGSDAGAWLFAEVLLNLSQPWNKRVEVNLEGPFGFGGVEPDSAEVRFWLPGSAGWEAYERD